MVALLLLMAVSAGGDGGSVAPGTPIVAIRVVRHDVYDVDDPETSAWPYRLADHLHFLSREAFIRRLLLFKVGDPLDPAGLAESERVLRGLGFLNPVDIRASPVAGGALVTVETHDQWTTEASVTYGRFGRSQRTGFTVAEENLFGWGKKLEVEVRSNPTRTTRIFSYLDPQLLGSRWRLFAAHLRNSDGRGDSLDLEYPFFSLATPRAGGLEWSRLTMTEYLWSGNEKIISGQASERDFRLWSGWRIPWQGDATDRLLLGIFGDKATYSGWSHIGGGAYPNPAPRTLAGFQVGWDHEVDRWLVVHGFRAWQRQEDVALGPNWNLLVGVSAPAFGGDRTRFTLDGSAFLATLTGRQYSWTEVSLSGRLDGSSLDNTVTHLELGTARTGPVGWRARLAADLGTRLDLDQQLTLGADTGLRGWDPNTFDGTSRAVLNVEWRHVLTGDVLHVGIIGLAVFGDAGKTWAARVDPSTAGVRRDAGLGLLVELTRASILRVVRVELAWPDQGKPLFLVTSTSLF